MPTVYTVILPQTFGLFLSPEKEKNGLADLLFIKYSCLNLSGYSLCTLLLEKAKNEFRWIIVLRNVHSLGVFNQEFYPG